jgi:uncharacterized membrane protein (UPF0127 family)
MSRLAPLLLVILLLGACGGAAQESEDPVTGNEAQPVVTIETSDGERVEVRVEVAADTVSRTRGLMERTELAEDAGMLFVFEEEQQLSFWMKDTLIPLSIAYISSGGEIIDIQDMEPLDETPHPSARPAQYALEVNQGFFEENGVGVGDRVELPKEAR